MWQYLDSLNINAATRLICKESRYCHITTLLRHLHWLPVHYCIIFKILFIAFKAIHRPTPEYISCLVRIRSWGRFNLRSQEGIILTGLHASRLTYKTLGDRAFAVAAPKLWNDLPVSVTIRNCASIYSFKSELKTHLFKQAFLEFFFFHIIVTIIYINTTIRVFVHTIVNTITHVILFDSIEL